MNISAKTDYACKALIELAAHWPNNEPLPIAVIARNQKVPIKFLTHILIQLKSMGLVQSIRGQKGGYILVKQPKDITIRDVVEGFAEFRLNPSRHHGKRHVLDGVWQEAEKEYLGFLEGVTFEEILNRERKIGNVPMYAI